jgi:hypothetical protein
VPSIFFGYPAQSPAHTEILRTAAKQIEEQTGASPVLWEDMRVDGRIIMRHVLSAIDDADMCIFDLTWQSENVLFEAGYAIARGKRVWLTMDTTVATAKMQWREFGLFKPVGYTEYRNSSELVACFVDADPLNAVTTVYDDLIEPSLPEDEARRSVLYCSTFEPFEASNRLSRLLRDRQKRGLNLVVSDPSESGLEPITWYAPAITRSAGVLVHFAGSQRNLASLHNRRHALVAGMACGVEVPTLMLSEAGYPAPFDYETLLKSYDTAEECVAIARGWLDQLELEKVQWNAPRASLHTALSGLRFGEHVAENELAELADYFVETSAFKEVVAARDTIFVGQRGTGKTANATQAFELIASNKTNMAVLIKPPGFEFPALFSVIDRLPAFQHDYFFDALWRFVIQTEIATSVLARIEDRAVGVPLDSAEEGFVSYAERAPFDMRADMSVRLEQALDHLISTIGNSDVAAGETRNLINEAFHSNALVELRHQLGPVLKDKRRVAIFVDNLDKGWERGANFKLVARLILGLLTARGKLVRDFQRQDYWRDRIKLTVAMFLRSDIYGYLVKEAREPDKLPISTISWRDGATLLTVVESRFISSSASPSKAADLWKRYFCETIAGQPTRDFIVSVVLPRPRDIVYFCNAAVGRAIDRRHERVESEDFQAAEETYSQYAYEALLVENGVTIPEMREALFEFLGANPVLTRSEILALLESASLPEGRRAEVLAKLVLTSFLGLETKPDTFTFADVGSAMDRAAALASKLQPNPDDQRFKIHRAFHSFLLVEDPFNIDAA